MQAHHQTLQTIYKIAKDHPHPTSYPISPRELILTLPISWDIIQQQLTELEKEELVSIQHLEKPLVSITALGIQRATEQITATK